MTQVRRAIEKGETRGFMKILVDADSQLILGAAILGTGGDEVIHGILDTMYAKAPYVTLQHAVHVHPTVSELIPTMLGELSSPSQEVMFERAAPARTSRLQRWPAGAFLDCNLSSVACISANSCFSCCTSFKSIGAS